MYNSLTSKGVREFVLKGKNTLIKPTRIPPAVDGIQVNYCKNPSCKNFGVPALANSAGKQTKDIYTISGASSSVSVLKCKSCGEFPTIKSNLAISEEFNRLMADLIPAKTPSCPDTQCANHQIPVNLGKGHYQSYGMTHSGSKRYLCKGCKRTFTVSSVSTLRQRQPEKNELIFRLLVNSAHMRRTCAILDINPKTLYQRIDFLYQQCKAFAAVHERPLLEGMAMPRLYVAVDRQEYILNWSNQYDRRNVVVRAVGSADQHSGYVFGMHLDFDPSLDPSKIEADAIVVNDNATQYAYRRYARLWLKSDYTDSLHQLRSIKRRKRRALLKDVEAEVADVYDALADRLDVEAPLSQTFDTKLPTKGMQVHSEYTLYGHFLYLKRLFGGVDKVRFFLDQDSGMRAACLSAFCDEVKARRADAFFVRINKNFTTNEKIRAVGKGEREFKAVKSQNPGLPDQDVKVLMIQTALTKMTKIGKWDDRWVLIPLPSMPEPEKAVCYLTDYQDYAADHLARLYLKASMHPIDRYFMQVRRMVSLLERPIASSSSQNRTWFGRSSYSPEVVMKMQMIYRVFYNYMKEGEDKRTPAMRLGLAKKVISYDEVINFVR